MCEKYDIIWGGEQSIKNIAFEKFIKLLQKYIGEIYKRVGEKQSAKQNHKKLAKFEKKEKKEKREKKENEENKENKEKNHIHALNKYISF